MGQTNSENSYSKSEAILKDLSKTKVPLLVISYSYRNQAVSVTSGQIHVSTYQRRPATRAYTQPSLPHILCSP